MGKDLVTKTLKHEKVDSVPWVPFAGVHAGKLKDYNARDVLTNGDKLYESIIEVFKTYKPDGLPILFDLQVEAEILGCDLLWAQDTPPSVRSHPFKDTNEMPCPCLIPNEESGRLPMILDVMRRVKAEIGEQAALYGLICGPFTLASHLRGTDLFMDMVKDGEYVKNLIEFCTEVSVAMSGMYIDAGMDVIAVVDPLISQISPKHIKSLMFDAYTALFDFIRSKDAFSSFFVCGNATGQLDIMCQTKPDSVSVDENVDLAVAKPITDKYNITIGGNIPPATTMLYGDEEENVEYVNNILSSVDHFNLIVSPGCDMPYDVPIENVIAIVNVLKPNEP